MIEFQGIEKRFAGVRAVGPVSFDLPPGATLGLVGENGAGKSTLMNLLGGNLQPDAGSMRLAERPYAPHGPAEAMRCGIAFIHQELNLFGNLTIAENLFLTRFPRWWRSPFIYRTGLRAEAGKLLAQVGLELDPHTPMDRLAVGECQLVEIAKALAGDPRLIIFDEPTSSLSTREAERLFALMAGFRRQGRSLIYISHALGDVLRLCDDLVILRDGLVAGRGPARDFTIPRLISLMAGRVPEATAPAPAPPREPAGAVALAVRGVSRPGVVRDISFELRRGEILGIAGMMGAGRSELARILFGLDAPAAGELRLHGRPLQGATVRERVRRGMAFVTEDRRGEGLCLEASVADNLALAALPAFARGRARRIDRPGLQAALTPVKAAVRLTADADGRAVKTLSGGNQQKVVLAKWLLTKPGVIILDEPTRGIDVGAKCEIHELIRALAAAGTAVLLISSELEELTALCDRLLVLNRGEITATLARAEFDQARILAAALPGERSA